MKVRDVAFLVEAYDISQGIEDDFSWVYDEILVQGRNGDHGEGDEGNHHEDIEFFMSFSL